jgi:quercetin dioxygenase-like cupin family protein
MNLPTRKQEHYMNKSLIALGVAAAVVIAGSAGAAGKEKKSAKKKEVIYVSSEQATYKERGRGASMAVLWGDPDKGAHGTFTKFAPGYDAGMHTHTSDVWLVVIKGAYLYKDDAGEKRVGPGEFIWIPSGHKHWSGGDKTEGALFYQEGSKKFDLLPVKE